MPFRTDHKTVTATVLCKKKTRHFKEAIGLEHLVKSECAVEQMRNAKMRWLSLGTTPSYGAFLQERKAVVLLTTRVFALHRNENGTQTTVWCLPEGRA